MKSRHTDNIFRANVIWQGIMVDPGVERSSRDDDVFLWDANSRGIKHNPYFSEMLSELHCDTSNSEEIIDVYNAKYLDGVVVYPIRSICRWPERAEIEKRKAADLEEFDELRNIDSYGNVRGLI